MEAFVVKPTTAPHVSKIFLEAGKQSGKDGWFARFMDQLPGDVAKELKAHSKYLLALKDEGKLLFAGVEDDFIESFIVFAADNLEEARKLVEGDPFIKSGIFSDYRIRSLHHWI